MSTRAKSSIFTNNNDEIIFTNQIISQCENQLMQEFYEENSLNFPVQNLVEYLQNYSSNGITKLLTMDDKMISLIEDLILLMYNCTNAYQDGKFNKTRVITALIQFYKSQSETSFVKSLFKTKLLQFAKELLLDCDSAILDGPMQVQGAQEHFASMREFLDNFKSFKNSVLYSKLYKLCLFGMSYSIFDKLGLNFEKLGYTIFEAEAIKRKNEGNKIDLVYTICDSLLFLCERGYQIIVTGSMQYLYHSSKTYSEFYEKAEELKRKALLLHNPEAFDFTESSFRDELDTILEKCGNIATFNANLSKIEAKQFKCLHNELLLLKFNLVTKKAAREHRDAPFSVLLYGDSGIGKTTIKDILFYHFGKVRNLDTDKTFCYTRNPVANFWDGFSTSQWCVILDDVAFLHPNKAPNGDPSCTEFLQIINSTPFVPDQADLSDKGRTPLRAELVIATTNTENLNAHYYFSCASAAQRRFPYIIVPTVKKEYQDINGMLDSEKTVMIDGEYPNYWNWCIKKVKTLKADPINLGRPAPIDIIYNFDNIDDFLVWYSRTIIAFKENQNKVADSIQMINDIKICKLCYFSENKCRCEIQLSILETFIVTSILNYIISIFYTILIITSRIGQQWLTDLILSTVQSRFNYQVIYEYKKRVIASAGERVHNFIGKHTMLLKYISLSSILLVTGYVMKNFINLFVSKTDGTDIQGDNDDTEDDGIRPEPMENERENVWYSDDFQLSPIQLTPEITSSKSLCRQDFIKVIAQNVVHCVIDDMEGKRYRFKAFCVGGQAYITNSHNIPSLSNFPKANISLIVTHHKDGITRNFSFAICEGDLRRDKEKDLCIMIFKSMPAKKNMLKYIPKTIKECRNNGFYLTREDDGSLKERNIIRIHKISARYENLPSFGGYSWKGTVMDPTDFGDCGSIMIAETGMGYMIIGLHVAGFNENVASIELNSDLLRPLLKDHIMVQSGTPMLSAPSAPRMIGQLSHKSVFRYVEKGSAEIYGSFKGFRPQPKSRVELTPLVNNLTPHGYKIKYGAPVMNGWQPWRTAALDMVQPNNTIPSDKLELCKNQYINHIKSQIKKETLKEFLHVYDTFTAINGANGVAYVDKMKRNTSAGNPWKKSKMHFLKSIPAKHGLQEPVEVSDEILNRIKHIISEYKAGRRVHPNFCAHLKDEATSFLKMKLGKTRVFTGAPFDWSVVVRKYFLSIIRLIQNNKFAFETAVGTNAQSSEWQGIYNFLEFKDINDRERNNEEIKNKIAGDYSSYDKKMSAQVILVAFEVLIAMCEASGNYSEEDIIVLHCIAHDTAFALIDFNGDLVQFFGSNPSGHPLTVIINSIVNSLYIRLAYLDLHPEHKIDDFNKDVRFISYGDDNIMTSKRSWFNHTAIADSLMKFGIKYTMADKKAESVPFLNIKRVSFLKRTWVWNDEVQSYFAPLEEESIEKMLMVWVRSKTISSEEQSIAVISSAVREYFFYGKEIFNQKRNMLMEVVKSMNLTMWQTETTFPTWDELVQTFKRNSNKIQLDRYDISNNTFNRNIEIPTCKFEIQSSCEEYCILPFNTSCILYYHELNAFSRLVTLLIIYLYDYILIIRYLMGGRLTNVDIWWLLASIFWMLLHCMDHPEFYLLLIYFQLLGRSIMSY